MHVCFLTIASSLRFANGCLLALLPSPAIPPPRPSHLPPPLPLPLAQTRKRAGGHIRVDLLDKSHCSRISEDIPGESTCTYMYCIYACLKQYSYKRIIHLESEVFQTVSKALIIGGTTCTVNILGRGGGASLVPRPHPPHKNVAWYTLLAHVRNYHVFMVHVR